MKRGVVIRDNKERTGHGLGGNPWGRYTRTRFNYTTQGNYMKQTRQTRNNTPTYTHEGESNPTRSEGR